MSTAANELATTEAEARARVRSAHRLVIKIGSSLITRDGVGIDLQALSRWAADISALVQLGKQIVVVSSGAIAEGCVRLGLTKRPTALHELQAAAAVGQLGLSRAWEDVFSLHQLKAALILLTHEDVADRTRYLNARATLSTLLTMGVVPIINENDTVATDEIRLGDNDTLGALVTNLIDADVLLLLTDQQGLHRADPRVDPAAELLTMAAANDLRLDAMVGDSAGPLGRGGMATKIRAARTAALSGAYTVIAGGRNDHAIQQVFAGAPEGTLLVADLPKLDARRRWLAGHLQTLGRITLDEGAANALVRLGKSLLAVGVTAVTGEFGRGDMVSCVTTDGREIARGLINYSSDETLRIMRRNSDDFVQLLGYSGDRELMHRDNLVVL